MFAWPAPEALENSSLTSHLTADGTATILTQSIRATPRGPFRLAGRPLRRQLQQLIAFDLGRLKTLAEAQLPQN